MGKIYEACMLVSETSDGPKLAVVAYWIASPRKKNYSIQFMDIYCEFSSQSQKCYSVALRYSRLNDKFSVTSTNCVQVLKRKMTSLQDSINV